jgi:monoamine oxidase
MHKQNNIVIVGGGLCGLSLAYKLSQHDIKATILEGSSRLGGRIQTHMGSLDTPMELGATWISDMHENILNLLKVLGLETFPQFSQGISLFQNQPFQPPQEFRVPESESPSYRIAGGTEALICALSEKIDEQQIQRNFKVSSISETAEHFIIESVDGKTITAAKVILCLPPKLVHNSIRFFPELPYQLTKILPHVQTWMAGSLKFAIEYQEAFWRKSGYSGMLFSHSGIITEMYDHTNFEENKFGFTGFLNSSTASYSRADRQKLVLNQLSNFFGKKALDVVSYHDKFWTGEFVSDDNNFNLRPHQYNGHPVLQESYCNGRLYFSGTESSPAYSGYMEGAVISALNIARKIIG